MSSFARAPKRGLWACLLLAAAWSLPCGQALSAERQADRPGGDADPSEWSAGGDLARSPAGHRETVAPAPDPGAAPVPLKQISASLYQTEHCLFVIPEAGKVSWPTWSSVYSDANVASWVATLRAAFPSDYEFVVLTANDLTPNSVPNVLKKRNVGSGIGLNSFTSTTDADICRYNIGGGTVIEGAYAVLDHEIGHRWGVFIGAEMGEGHWLAASTADGQMASTYSDDGYVTVKRIGGTPAAGFRWTAIDNLTRNETETFSDHDLYLMGLHPTFPDLYVLASPVYKADGTVSYSSVAKYDQAWVVARNGVRSPDYRTSPKKFRTGFVYVARDAAEVQAVYAPLERSIVSFVAGEQVDRSFRFQVPFLVETKYRASVEALLSDLDGKRTPTLSVDGGGYVAARWGYATVPFTVASPDGSPVTVSCVPASPGCTVSGSTVLLTGLAAGAHFFTIKAETAAGKKAFAHFVVDQTDQAACTPDATTLCLLGNRFAVTADWTAYGGTAGPGRAAAITPDTGYFWFFDAKNVESVVKLVSFCGGGSNNVAVYAGGLTDVDVTLRVTDTRSKTTRTYRNPLGTPFTLIRDGPFACPAAPAPGPGGELGVAQAPGAPGRIVETTSWIDDRAAVEAGCTADSTTLCLLDGRFQVRAAYRDYGSASGSGKASALTADTGTFWFFDPKNVEVVAKMVSFCGAGTNNVALYAGGLTDLGVTLTVTDTKTGLVKSYSNAVGNPFQLVRDGPFTCP